MLIQSIVGGIPHGMLYGLMGFGIALIFRTTGVMNFAHGHSGMIGVCIAFSVFKITKNLFLAMLCGMGAGFGLGILIEMGLMRPIKHLSHGAMLIITLGLLMVFEGLSGLIWGAQYQTFPAIYKGKPLILHPGEGVLVITGNDILLTILAAAVSIIFALFLVYNKLGIAIRARAQDEVGAKAVGINTNRIDSLVWAAGIALAVLVGALNAPKSYVHPDMMTNMLIYGFTACVLGGFGNPFGAIAGGILLGILKQVVGTYISPDYQLSIIFIVIIVMLVFKPSGLFTRHMKARA